MNVDDRSPAATGPESAEIRIRPMTDDDVVPYCALFQNVFSQEPWNEKWTIPQINAIITKHRRKKGFVGMTAAAASGAVGTLTGFRLWLVPSLFYMDQLFVGVDYQGLKIGKRLLIETERHLKSQGVSHIMLLTKPRTYAEKFYLKNGYSPFLPAVRNNGKSLYWKCIRRQAKKEDLKKDAKAIVFL
jgi:GNAT superfamily N-acetyltransferase